MQSRNNLLLLGILVILIAVVGGLWWKDSDHKNTKLITEFESTKITKIGIEKNDKKVMLEKDGDNWKIDHKDIKKEKVQELLDAVVNLEILQIASKNPDNHKELDLGTEFGYKLTLNDKTWWIGREGPSVGTVYMKADGETNAYLVSGDIKAKVSEDEEYWLEVAGPTSP